MAVDAGLAAFWEADFWHGMQEETCGGGPLIIQAGRSAAPYLIRRQQWQKVSVLLQELTRLDRSPETVATVLPWLRYIASATERSEQEPIAAGLLAVVLRIAGRVSEAETILRDVMHNAAAQGQFRTASATAGNIITLLRDTGRAEEALALVKKMKDFTRRAGLGPWTQLAAEGGRLQLLHVLGGNEEVLHTVETLQTFIRALPEKSQYDETVMSWNVREMIFNTACNAALALGRWKTALTLNVEILASQTARGAPALEMARTHFNDYGPLLRLGHYRKVRTLLDSCRAIFEAEHAIEMLGRVFYALADLESELHHQRQAIDFAETALRYTYLARSPEDCAISHHNLSIYLERAGRERQVVLAHYLAAGAIRWQTGDGKLTSTLQNLARDFAACAPDLPPFLDNFDEMCRLVEAVEGVRFRELFERLPRRAATGDAALAVVRQRAQEIAQRMGQQRRAPATDPQRKLGKQGTRRRKPRKKRVSDD